MKLSAVLDDIECRDNIRTIIICTFDKTEDHAKGSMCLSHYQHIKCKVGLFS